MNEPVLNYDKLRILFRRASTLPPLPRGAARLIEEIDSDHSCAVTLERIISTDPALTAEVLRVASSAAGGTHGVTSLRQAILLLGQRSIRAMAVSLSVRALMKQGSRSIRFDGTRFARHSLFVGTLARYLHARAFTRADLTEEDWTSEELFAAGLLHDLGYALLSQIDPLGFDRVWQVAQALHVSLGEAFAKCVGGDVCELGALATDAWGFPKMLSEAQRHLREPFGLPQQIRGLCCLQYADSVSARFGEGLVGWPMQEQAVGTATLISIPEEEISIVVGLIHEDVEALMNEGVTAAAAHAA